VRLDWLRTEVRFPFSVFKFGCQPEGWRYRVLPPACSNAMRHVQDAVFAESWAINLQSDGKAGGSFAGRHGNSGHSCQRTSNRINISEIHLQRLAVRSLCGKPGRATSASQWRPPFRRLRGNLWQSECELFVPSNNRRRIASGENVGTEDDRRFTSGAKAAAARLSIHLD